MGESYQILLLSATVIPPSHVPNLVLTDPGLRLLDYERALAFYLTLIGKGVDYIVFAENSNADISRLHELVHRNGLQDRVELISFYGLDYPAEYGKGYGEFKLVDYAMSNSRLLSAEMSKAVIWKVTGRYVVKNLSEVIRQRPRLFDIYCNFRVGLTRPISKPKFLKWMDLFLLAWTTTGYESVIKNIYQELRADQHGEAEVRFRELLDRVSPPLRVVNRYTTVPFIDGFRGFDGQNFSQGINRWKYYSRCVAQRLTPWAWL
ncbi:MAG: hypothetical protein HS114_35270 [Anaerolineales bacterium]|nr:hypothetical protein [Anaerolineales bacterium]